MWLPLQNYTQTGNNFILSPPLSFNQNKLLLRCKAFNKPSWVVAGYAHISDGFLPDYFKSFQREKIFLGIDQYIQVNSSVFEILGNNFYLHFYPKSWVAEWGYDFGLWKWEVI